jgi:hypothetical protein
VGLGTSLLDSKAIAAGHYDIVVANGKKVVDNVTRARRRA